jgi:hypothetical protein
MYNAKIDFSADYFADGDDDKSSCWRYDLYKDHWEQVSADIQVRNNIQDRLKFKRERKVATPHFTTNVIGFEKSTSPL